jgi:hypothetical protein
MTSKRTRSQPAGARAGRLRRTLVAGGSAMVVGGAGLIVGTSAPAEANHAGTANSGILDTTNWRVCANPALDSGPARAGFQWATELWNDHPELSVVRTCTNSNVTYEVRSFVETWRGLTTCPPGVDADRNCAAKRVQMNTRTINLTPNPPSQYKKTACHEMGHVGGLNHRAEISSCMNEGLAPPTSQIPDQHDNDAIAATYPR